MSIIIRPAASYIFLGAAAAVSLLTVPVLHGLWPDRRWHHLPLHSTMEALGGLAMIAMATVLFQRWEQEHIAKFQALGSGLLGMGLLDIFHAIAPPGNGFVLLRNMASFVGGVGFASVWLADSPLTGPRRFRMPWLIAAGALSLGIWTLAAPETIPEMIRNGEFTPTAVAPQSLASLLFMAASWRLLAAYGHTGRSEDYVFASLALLFALAELVFMYSMPWDARWWFWHALRLTACLLMLGYLGQRYLRMVTELKHALDERQRMAEDLHDGAIQSIFAVTLGLERCRRQTIAAPHETAGRLDTLIEDLKTVIRDLRGYLLGLEAPVRSGNDLAVSLASLARSMDNPIQTQFQLDIDTAAADQVTADQAGHLVAIAREAMSNSVRHSSARSGKLSLVLRDGHVLLVMEDDGIGFQSTPIPQGGHGLKNMEARAKKLGGRLEVWSEPGRGTRIACELPSARSHASI